MANIQKLVEDELTKNYAKYYRLAFSYANNEEDALDIIQEGSYKAIKKAKSLKNPEFVSTWIYRIMINEAVSLLRAKKKVVSLPDYDTEGKNDDYEDPDLGEAIKTLDLTDQTIIKLRFFEDLPLKEISKITELNENTVKTRLYRSLEKLKLKLEV